jgi:hypothetical protein
VELRNQLPQALAFSYFSRRFDPMVECGRPKLPDQALSLIDATVYRGKNLAERVEFDRLRHSY